MSTDRIDPDVIETAAKARWEAACAHHRAEGQEHPTWDEVGSGEWAPYPKALILEWEEAAIRAADEKRGLRIETKLRSAFVGPGGLHYPDEWRTRLVTDWRPVERDS